MFQKVVVFCSCIHKSKKIINILSLQVRGWIWLTGTASATSSSASFPFAIINHALPLAGEVTIQKVRVLTADGHHVEVATEVLQLHPDTQNQAQRERQTIYYQVSLEFLTTSEAMFYKQVLIIPKNNWANLRANLPELSIFAVSTLGPIVWAYSVPQLWPEQQKKIKKCQRTETKQSWLFIFTDK